MKIIWDERKRQSNIVKHGLDFVQAHMVFAGATFTFEDTRMDYGEQRFVTIGLLDGVVVIVHTESTDEIRMISMRKATKNEQRLYFKNLYG
ncbi:BrnT family toxin [Desulfobacter curvatus]|uniref:BrnT family toxin n=1 Tax=Desulfobacter curvatus TaxID=2290 RepID=UPI00036BF1A7|nr:BrnT family toxin [Desulfobacter curvatus]